MKLDEILPSPTGRITKTGPALQNIPIPLTPDGKHIADRIKGVMITSNTPADAARHIFGYRGNVVEYHIWSRPRPIPQNLGRVLWFWSCLGNDGSAMSEKEAEEKARRWARDSQ